MMRLRKNTNDVRIVNVPAELRTALPGYTSVAYCHTILLSLSTVKLVVRSEEAFLQVAYVCEFGWKQAAYTKMPCFPIVIMTYVG
jgi:hypothetical protein